MSNTKNITWLGTKYKYHTSKSNNNDYKYKRTPFDRDFGSIIYLSEFRKLYDKTQVYSTEKGTNRNRLSHSLEVYNIALQIWRQIYYELLCNNKLFEKVDTTIKNAEYWKRYDRGVSIEKILECCCLSHDIGHPPFAHAGEKELQKSIKFRRVFDSNIQNIRILCNIGSVGKINNIEVNTAVLDAVLKHKPGGPFDNFVFNSDETSKIIGVSKDTETYISYKEFKKLYDSVVESNSDIKKHDIISLYIGKIKSIEKEDKNIRNCDGKIYLRHPLAYIMEAADDISYLSADLEDAINEGILERNDIIELFEELDFKFYDNDYKIDNKIYKKFKKNNCSCKDDDAIKKYINELFSECEEKSSFSKLKTYVIRFLLKNCIDNFLDCISGRLAKKQILKTFNFKFKENSKKKFINQVSFLNKLDEIFFYYSMLKYRSEEKSEFGNFLYFNLDKSKKNGEKIKKFKKEMNNKIFNSARILNDNTLASHVVSRLIDILVPDTYSKDDIIKVSAFLPISFRKMLLEEIKKSETKAEEVILDFIASLNDKEAQDLLKKLEEESFFKYGKLNKFK
ncbi:dNTP triphosphohydrolase [Pigmentibacter sp. JX0631]|uniref:dGTP triphosphohydrolase n=1 Tax=Pigmentibacter sp. JX0631 TaxID=2976982 RepID=UPI00246952C0|nr:dNTP triphosphohydrolase [Pigmentibacter sp. JX0631]WGL60525.1 dNTP triphosphohydrolase [Pigmentibacter sp. JX0631]